MLHSPSPYPSPGLFSVSHNSLTTNLTLYNSNIVTRNGRKVAKPPVFTAPGSPPQGATPTRNVHSACYAHPTRNTHLGRAPY